MFGLGGELAWRVCMYMLLFLRCGHVLVSGMSLITLDTAKLGFKRSGWPTYSHFTSSCVRSKGAAVCARGMSSCVRWRQELLCAHLKLNLKAMLNEQLCALMTSVAVCSLGDGQIAD